MKIILLEPMICKCQTQRGDEGALSTNPFFCNCQTGAKLTPVPAPLFITRPHVTAHSPSNPSARHRPPYSASLLHPRNTMYRWVLVNFSSDNRPDPDSQDTPISDAEVARLYNECMQVAMARVRANQEKYTGGLDEVLRRFGAIIDDAAELMATKHGPGLTAARVDVRSTVQLLRITWRCKWTALKDPLEEGLADAVAKRIERIEAGLYADTQARSGYYEEIRRAAHNGTPSAETLKPLILEIYDAFDNMLEADRPEILRGVQDEFKEALAKEMEMLLPARYTCTLPGRRCECHSLATPDCSLRVGRSRGV